MDYGKLKMLLHFNRQSLLIMNVVAWKLRQTDDYTNENTINIVQSLEFQQLWHLNKDKINVCKDCHDKFTKNETVHRNVKTSSGYKTREINM